MQGSASVARPLPGFAGATATVKDAWPPAQDLSLAAVLAALDIGLAPLLLLTLDGVIEHATKAGWALLRAGRGLSAVDNRFTIRRKRDNQAAQAALAQVFGGNEPVTIQLVSRQGDISHLMTYTQLPSVDLAALSIAELRVPLLLPRDWTRRAFGLSLGLAELAEALAAGENLAEFTERTGLSTEGARTRLKKLLAHTATRSQADLVALLHRAASAVPAAARAADQRAARRAT